MKALETVGAIVPDEAEETLWLRYWHWLVPSDFKVIGATAIGDAFLRDPHGSVWWLDIGSASLELIGEQATWERMLTDPAQLDQWSARVLIPLLEKAGLKRGPRECYTYWTAPVLGGDYVPSNFKVVPVQTHFDIWGPILEQIKDLPDGTQVEIKVVP